MKILKSSKANVAICWSGLKHTAPKEFPNIGEMETAANILPLLEERVPEFAILMKEGEQMNIDIQSGKIPMNNKQEARNNFAKKATILEQTKGKEMVEIEFEDAAFNTLFQQFERWGKLWFIKLEEYLEFRKDMNSTNSQPKGEK